MNIARLASKDALEMLQQQFADIHRSYVWRVPFDLFFVTHCCPHKGAAGSRAS